MTYHLPITETPPKIGEPVFEYRDYRRELKGTVKDVVLTKDGYEVEVSK